MQLNVEGVTYSAMKEASSYANPPHPFLPLPPLSTSLCQLGGSLRTRHADSGHQKHQRCLVRHLTIQHNLYSFAFVNIYNICIPYYRNTILAITIWQCSTTNRHNITSPVISFSTDPCPPVSPTHNTLWSRN